MRAARGVDLRAHLAQARCPGRQAPGLLAAAGTRAAAASTLSHAASSSIVLKAEGADCTHARTQHNPPQAHTAGPAAQSAGCRPLRTACVPLPWGCSCTLLQTLHHGWQVMRAQVSGSVRSTTVGLVVHAMLASTPVSTARAAKAGRLDAFTASSSPSCAHPSHRVVLLPARPPPQLARLFPSCRCWCRTRAPIRLMRSSSSAMPVNASKYSSVCTMRSCLRTTPRAPPAAAHWVRVSERRPTCCAWRQDPHKCASFALHQGGGGSGHHQATRCYVL